ncbi:rust resistance kinase Lr10-like isoform X1 [Cucurbita pepo subsp. pepo]|uniref:rust resistance kinase Lr10-like isoform X1 n=2 Tax=Cucurbita pepo subsp. pepo TaxID=3664 RepID=UPI000C9D3BB7|nr:rust resistance kinase Lr10-like isoform X1 [Cucurbita pepo subsp. pepo]XP_023524203.1 rust resistance kinase Lr10-like isoform X1 [Cucurbita pepo subsp. pepo]XP_023524204.1 rust resistance kinase Lr10-like isoform X1 [Cucurbita pepo subsp. pepo]
MSSVVYSPDTNSSSNFITTAISVVVTLVIFIVIGAISCCFARKAKQCIVTELRNAVASSASNVAHSSAPNAVPVWEIDQPTMEKFIKEMAEQRPIRFTAHQLYYFTGNYSTPLGSGGFGTVYKGEFPNGVKIAAKVLKRNSDKQAEEQFMNEVGTIGKTYHINLVRLNGFCYDHYMCALVFEYMENRSLDKYLFGKNEELDWGKLRDVAIGTAKGLAYLHEECQQKIIHYDIKPANILLDENFTPKVGDFGLAKLCNRDSTHMSLTGYRGTPGYSAPEFLLKNYPITHKCDVYSFGMVLFEIIGRKRNGGVTDSGNPDWFPQHVWEAQEKGELVEFVRRCGYAEDDKEGVIWTCEVALWCIQDCPDERPPMSAVVKMLEGGVEIMPPSKPFLYLDPTPKRNSRVSNLQQTSSSSDYSTSNEDSASYWYKKTTPIMKKYEIQIASS